MSTPTDQDDHTDVYGLEADRHREVKHDEDSSLSEQAKEKESGSDINTETQAEQVKNIAVGDLVEVNGFFDEPKKVVSIDSDGKIEIEGGEGSLNMVVDPAIHTIDSVYKAPRESMKSEQVSAGQGVNDGDQTQWQAEVGMPNAEPASSDQKEADEWRAAFDSEKVNTSGQDSSGVSEGEPTAGESGPEVSSAEVKSLVDMMSTFLQLKKESIHNRLKRKWGEMSDRAKVSAVLAIGVTLPTVAIAAYKYFPLIALALRATGSEGFDSMEMDGTGMADGKEPESVEQGTETEPVADAGTDPVGETQRGSQAGERSTDSDNGRIQMTEPEEIEVIGGPEGESLPPDEVQKDEGEEEEYDPYAWRPEAPEYTIGTGSRGSDGSEGGESGGAVESDEKESGGTEQIVRSSESAEVVTNVETSDSTHVELVEDEETGKDVLYEVDSSTGERLQRLVTEEPGKGATFFDTGDSETHVKIVHNENGTSTLQIVNSEDGRITKEAVVDFPLDFTDSDTSEEAPAESSDEKQHDSSVSAPETHKEDLGEVGLSDRVEWQAGRAYGYENGDPVVLSDPNSEVVQGAYADDLVDGKAHVEQVKMYSNSDATKLMLVDSETGEQLKRVDVLDDGNVVVHSGNASEVVVGPQFETGDPDTHIEQAQRYDGQMYVFYVVDSTSGEVLETRQASASDYDPGPAELHAPAWKQEGVQESEGSATIEPETRSNANESADRSESERRFRAPIDDAGSSSESRSDQEDQEPSTSTDPYAGYSKAA
ncbi:MAG: hypothetical protein WDZ82_01000 [Candidatus Paceibacterota bacterium]